MEQKLRIAGNVVGELSDKIPTNIIALNELIKNSYDAGAKEVTITLDSTKQRLIISDDGDGMDESDISALLHISKSTKKYGEINPVTGRYIQGSKGLGFLSVFKFGDSVTWVTYKDKLRTFSIDYQHVLSLEDVGDYTVPIIEDDSDKRVKGTTIEIALRNPSMALSLSEYLRDEMNRSKVLNSFLDESFNISIIIDGVSFNTIHNIDIASFYKDKRLFHVTYSSASDQITFEFLCHPRYNTVKKTISQYTHKFSIDPRYRLSINIMVFDFHGGRPDNPHDGLFKKPPQKITPLIYINKNFFSNYSLFDPEGLRYSKYTSTLPQMIGYIEVLSSDSLIQFNSDRTQFQENELTKSISKVLEEINRYIQINGSELKKEIGQKQEKEKHTVIPIETPTSIDIIPDDDIIKKQEDTQPLTIRAVELSVTKTLRLTAPTSQINLRSHTYILKAMDSYGKPINYKDIDICINGSPNPDGILSSIDSAREILVDYSYKGPKSDCALARMKIIVSDQPLDCIVAKRALIPNKGIAGYSINFRANPVGGLITQLNTLYEVHGDDYLEVIVCSLRAIFELSIYELIVDNKVRFIKANGIQEFNLDATSKNLITKIAATPNLVTAIADGIGLSYKQLNDEIKAIEIEKVINKCHLGAHKSALSLGKSDLLEIGSKAGLFLVIVNELLNNTKISGEIIGQPWMINV